jgi:dTDP-4-dehydrorhamnose reductase
MMLLIGGDSEIGVSTARFLKAQGLPVWATTRRRDRVSADRPFLDLAAELDDWKPPPGTRSACILAAIARLAACAADPAGSALINVTRTLTLIERLIAGDSHVLFLSTNQVFDGLTPNVEPDAPTCPVSEYGRQKARVEMELRRHMGRGAPVAILRLGRVVAPAMPLIEGWSATLTAGQPISAFHDMPLAPTPIDLVAKAIGALMRDRASGIYQLTGPRDASYAEVGRFLAHCLGVDPALVTEVSARDAGQPEGSTPHHTTLDSSCLCQRYGLTVPDVWVLMDQLVSTSAAARRPGGSTESTSR